MPNVERCVLPSGPGLTLAVRWQDAGVVGWREVIRRLESSKVGKQEVRGMLIGESWASVFHVNCRRWEGR